MGILKKLNKVPHIITTSKPRTVVTKNTTNEEDIVILDLIDDYVENNVGAEDVVETPTDTVNETAENEETKDSNETIENNDVQVDVTSNSEEVKKPMRKKRKTTEKNEDVDKKQ